MSFIFYPQPRVPVYFPSCLKKNPSWFFFKTRVVVHSVMLRLDLLLLYRPVILLYFLFLNLLRHSRYDVTVSKKKIPSVGSLLKSKITHSYLVRIHGLKTKHI